MTLKLENGGLVVSDGILQTVGEPNKVSGEEVSQRTMIRYLTQTRSNLMHPIEGFDYHKLVQLEKTVEDSYGISPDKFMEMEVTATLSQDPEIDYQTALISIERSSETTYTVHISYKLKGSAQETLEFLGSVMSF
jgi:hypothetical protein